MAELNPGILQPGLALQANPIQQQNPLQVAGSALGLKNALLQNQSNQLSLNANQAYSSALKNHVDANGNVDWNGAIADLARDPSAAINVPQAAQAAQSQKTAQLQNQTAHLKLAADRQNAAANLVGGLLLNPKYGKADMSGEIIGAVQNGLQSGLFGDPNDPATLQNASRYVAEIPQDPQQQATWIKQHYLSANDSFNKITALLPKTGLTDTGGNIIATNTDPLSGQVSQTGVINKSLTPETLASNVQVINPATGEQGVITKAAQLGLPGPGNTGGGYTGRYGDNGAQGGAPGFTPTGLGPAAQAAQSAAGSNASNAAQGLSNEVNGAPVRINNLQEARDKLANIDTGKGAASFNEAKQYIATNPLLTDIAQKAGLDLNKVNNFAEFNKIVTQYANQTSAGLGTGTNDRLNATIAGNANTNMPNAANKYVLTKAIAAEQYRSALNDAWQNSGNSPEKFNQFLSQWNKNVPVEVFAYSAMTPDQRAEYQAKLQKSGGLDKFRTQYNAIHAQGLLGQ